MAYDPYNQGSSSVTGSGLSGGFKGGVFGAALGLLLGVALPVAIGVGLGAGIAALATLEVGAIAAGGTVTAAGAMMIGGGILGALATIVTVPMGITWGAVGGGALGAASGMERGRAGNDMAQAQAAFNASYLQTKMALGQMAAQQQAQIMAMPRDPNMPTTQIAAQSAQLDGARLAQQNLETARV